MFIIEVHNTCIRSVALSIYNDNVVHLLTRDNNLKARENSASRQQKLETNRLDFHQQHSLGGTKHAERSHPLKITGYQGLDGADLA